MGINTRLLKNNLKILNISREAVLRKVVVFKKENRIILSLPYDRRMTNIPAIIHQHWSYSVTQNPGLKKVLPIPPMVSYKKPKSLRENLTRSQLPPKLKCRDLRKRVGFKRCNMTKQNIPHQRRVKVISESTIYSLTCIKGSGNFHKKPGKLAKSIPLDGSSDLDGEHSKSYQKDEGPKMFSCQQEGQYIG